MEHEGDGFTNCNLGLDTLNKELVQGLEKLEIRRREKAIQITALLKSARILRRILET